MTPAAMLRFAQGRRLRNRGMPPPRGARLACSSSVSKRQCPDFLESWILRPRAPEVQRETRRPPSNGCPRRCTTIRAFDGIFWVPAIGACVGYVGLVEETAPQNTVEPGVTAVTTADGGVRVRRVATPIHTGADGLEALLGKCAAFLADPARAQCLLFNDRSRRERLFLHVDGRRTFFSSRSQGNSRGGAANTAGLIRVGLAEFLACGCTLGSRSLFRDIEVLEGGANTDVREIDRQPPASTSMSQPGRARPGVWRGLSRGVHGELEGGRQSLCAPP